MPKCHHWFTEFSPCNSVIINIQLLQCSSVLAIPAIVTIQAMLCNAAPTHTIIILLYLIFYTQQITLHNCTRLY